MGSTHTSSDDRAFNARLSKKKKEIDVTQIRFSTSASSRDTKQSRSARTKARSRGTAASWRRTSRGASPGYLRSPPRLPMSSDLMES